ncbi:MAG TPA: hypothetical protein VGX48_23575 [Pyrinomonadaceae bacterium]|jgi:hypothetical protein|nr:hypothetical protein [Pyrinomonadaceae bacterium]
MNTARQRARRLSPLISAAALAFFLSHASPASAQWTTSGNNTTTTNNVGIGTTTPQSALDVSGSTGITLRTGGSSSGFGIFDRPQDPGAQLVFQGTGANYSVFNVMTKNATFTSPVTSAIAMWTVDNANTANATQFQFQHSPSFGGVIFTQKFGTGAQGDKKITLQSVWSQAATPTQLVLDTNGKVGVGVSSPTEALDVNGNINVSGNINAKYQDVAEWVPSRQKLAAGTVVVLDTEHSNQVLASLKAYDTKVAGVISARPGIALGERGEGRVLVATTGRVKVRVDATRAPVRVGDLLVTSDVEGVAMKSVPVNLGGVEMHRPGTIVGKALEPLAGGVGEILVLLSMQ